MSVDVAYVHGNRMRERLVQELGLRSADHVKVLPHGAPDPGDVSLPSPLEARRKLGVPEGARVLLSFDTLRRDKNLSLLVQAVAHSPDWVLLHAGPEGDATYEELEALAETHRLGSRLIIHKRFIPAEDQVAYFAAADIVAALYDPRMTHESGTAKRVRAFSRPILASGPPDLTDYVSEWGVGYVVPPGRPVEAGAILTRHAMLPAGERDALEKRVRRAGRALSWTTVAQQISTDLETATGNV